MSICTVGSTLMITILSSLENNEYSVNSEYLSMVMSTSTQRAF